LSRPDDRSDGVKVEVEVEVKVEVKVEQGLNFQKPFIILRLYLTLALTLT